LPEGMHTILLKNCVSFHYLQLWDHKLLQIVKVVNPAYTVLDKGRSNNLVPHEASSYIQLETIMDMFPDDMAVFRTPNLGIAKSMKCVIISKL
jgi:hypothetical protein